MSARSDIPKKDLTGSKFGRLTVVGFAGWKNFACGERKHSWECVCDCGQKARPFGSDLISGKTQSCGCYHKEMASQAGVKRIKHGATRKGKHHPLYGIWRGMKFRCENPNAEQFPNYGGRGIRVLWNSYEDFSSDMAPTYRHGLSIERVDNNGPYCKDNCRWATPKEQQRNTRRNRTIEFNGQKLPISEWEDRLGFNKNTLWARLNRGWSVERTLSTPL